MSQPRDASLLSERENVPRRQSRNRRGRSRTPRSLSAGSDEPDYPPANRSDRRRNEKKKGGLPAVDEVEDTSRAVNKNTPRDTANKLAETVAQNSADGGKEDSTLSLRLDLNLDVYVKLTAKIHGDLTLTLL
jgi:hypothetical protein